MPINHNDYICLDTETTGLSDTKQLCEIAAVIVDARKLEIKDQGIFHSLCKIIPDEKCEEYGIDVTSDKALEVNGLTREDLENAPDLKTVWKDFENWALYHNPTKNKWNAPIPVGQNLNFDMSLINNIHYGLYRGNRVLKSKYVGPTARKKMSKDELIDIINSQEFYKEPWKFGKKEIFHPSMKIEIMQFSHSFWESNKYPAKIRQDTVLDYLGIDRSKAHTALADTLRVAELLIRWLKLHRQMSKDIDFDTNGETVLNIDELLKAYDKRK